MNYSTVKENIANFSDTILKLHQCAEILVGATTSLDIKIDAATTEFDDFVSDLKTASSNDKAQQAIIAANSEASLLVAEQKQLKTIVTNIKQVLSDSGLI